MQRAYRSLFHDPEISNFYLCVLKKNVQSVFSLTVRFSMRFRSVLICASLFAFAPFSSLVLAQDTGEGAAAATKPAVNAEVPTAPTPAADPAPAPEQKTDAAPAAAPAPAPVSEPAPEPAPSEAPPAPDVVPAGEPARRAIQRRGTLPLGYRDFVTKEQREQIYDIQKKYRPRMEELEKEMDALRAEMIQEIQTVLTPEQRQKIQTRENEIRARRALKKQVK